MTGLKLLLNQIRKRLRLGYPGVYIHGIASQSGSVPPADHPHVMSTLTMDTLAAWKRAVEDPQLEDLPYKVETNEHGQLVLSPTSLSHSKHQSRIHDELSGFFGADGRVFPELAVETSKGVKVPDVSWMSNERLATIGDDVYAVPVAPELCIEVLSPRNTQGEMGLKRALYFERGAREVWVCGQSGAMHFYDTGGELAASRLVPDFPRQID